ncbi:hypothetical protein CLV95_12147 [Leptospira borgpetersenii serovar Javanica]|nr:hypothetical protein CLV95_12147 [Leptospira borgpetersenii serovar Javanica]
MCNTGFFLQKPFTFRNSFAQEYKKRSENGTEPDVRKEYHEDMLIF